MPLPNTLSEIKKGGTSMFYQLYEMNHAVMAPFRAAAVDDGVNMLGGFGRRAAVAVGKLVQAL